MIRRAFERVQRADEGWVALQRVIAHHLLASDLPYSYVSYLLSDED